MIIHFLWVPYKSWRPNSFAHNFNIVKNSPDCKSKCSNKIPDRKIYTSSTLVRGAK